jgi:hypothetical protein
MEIAGKTLRRQLSPSFVALVTQPVPTSTLHRVDVHHRGDVGIRRS